MAFKKKEPPPRKDSFKFPKLSYTGPFKQAVEIAEFYGFSLIEPLKIKKADRDLFAKDREKSTKKSSREGGYEDMDLSPEERASVTRIYLDEEMRSYAQPITFCHIDRNLRKKEGFFKLEVLGSAKSMSEALLIHTALTILKNRGDKDVCVFLNSIGDDESEEQYREELIEYFREHLNLLDPDCRQAFTNDPYEIFKCSCKSEQCSQIKEDAPKSLTFLSEHSRKHFGEVLEHLETLGVPYQINDGLISHPHYHSKDLFEIRENKEDGKVLAKGEHFDGIGKMLGMKRSLPAAVISIKYHKIPKTERYSKSKKKKSKKPLFFFMQLGFDAKRKSLEVLEMLRNSKINLRHELFRDDMRTQREIAISEKAPYAIIVGQKEANEESAIVRELDSRAQETVPLSELGKYIKKLK